MVADADPRNVGAVWGRNFAPDNVAAACMGVGAGRTFGGPDDVIAAACWRGAGAQAATLAGVNRAKMYAASYLRVFFLIQNIFCEKCFCFGKAYECNNNNNNF